MDKKQNKEIVNNYGETLNSTQENKAKQFLKNNIWNILGIGLAACITLVGGINWIASKIDSIMCANFYGMDRRYFCGTEIFDNKVIFVLLTAIITIYPIIMSQLVIKMNSKIYAMVFSFFAVLLLFMQNVSSVVYILERVPWDWLRCYLDNYMVLGVLLFADIVIVYFYILRKVFWPQKKYCMFGKIVFVFALAVYFTCTVVELEINVTYDISDKKKYEVIEQDKAIVSNYAGKYVVIDCEIQDGTLILKKGSYRLIEMTDTKILYHEFAKVICE